MTDDQKKHQEAPVDVEEPSSSMNDGMTLGINLMVSMGITAFFGYWVDQWAGTKGIFLISFAFLGFLAGMLQIWRVMNK